MPPFGEKEGEEKGTLRLFPFTPSPPHRVLPQSGPRLGSHGFLEHLCFTRHLFQTQMFHSVLPKCRHTDTTFWVSLMRQWRIIKTKYASSVSGQCVEIKSKPHVMLPCFLLPHSFPYCCFSLQRILEGQGQIHYDVSSWDPHHNRSEVGVTPFCR